MFDYSVKSIKISLESIEKEYNELKEKYNSVTCGAPKGIPLVLVPQMKNYDVERISKYEIVKYIQYAQEYFRDAIIAVEENERIISENKKSYKIAFDIITSLGLKEHSYEIPKGKRTERLVVSKWVRDLQKIYPTEHLINKETVEYRYNHYLADFKKVEDKFKAIDLEAQREIERKNACALKIKHLGMLIAKYELPVESTKDDLIKKLFELNPMLKKDVESGGYYDEYDNWVDRNFETSRSFNNDIVEDYLSL